MSFATHVESLPVGARKMRLAPLDSGIRGGSAVFAYYPQKEWLSTSAFLEH